MIPFILATVGGFLVGNSNTKKENMKYSNGGVILYENDEFSINCPIDVRYNFDNLTYKNYKVDEIIHEKDIRLTYKVDMDIRGWGIESINIHLIKGPSEIEIDVNYFFSDDDYDGKSEKIMVKLDWDNIEIDTERKSEISIEETHFYLKNDENGDIVCNNIVVFTNIL